MKTPLSSRSVIVTALFTALFLSPALEAQAQYFSFGKNRVQYEDFSWKYIQSEHFDVHYYGTNNYALANFTVYSLEAALQQLSEDYDHEIANRIKVIIYDSHNDFSQTNVVPLPVDAEGIGGVTDLYKNRITMPFSGNYTEFRSTLHHELSHAVFNDMFYGGSVQALLNNNIQLNIPLWFNEGMAEYVSLGWDTNTDMFIRNAVINNYLPDIPNLGGYFAYRGGQAVWNYIAEEYGREKITEIIQIIKTRRSVEAGFRNALGLSLRELNDNFKDYYRRKYLPEVAERESIDNLGELLTDREERRTGSYNTSPAISPQGDKIAMITNRRGYMDVEVISAVTGERMKTLIKGEDNVNFEELNILNPNLSWSPDGQQLTLSAKSKGRDNLAVVNYESGDVQMIRIPDLDAIGSVAWSPDGEKIAFDGNIGPYQDIFVYNLETQDYTNLTNDVISDYEPAWSRDSQTVYFVSHRGDRVELNTHKNNLDLLNNDDLYSSDIYSVRLGADEASRITKTPLWSERQPFSTEENNLYYISDQNGIPNVYQFDLDNRTSGPITNLETGVQQISLSADGSRLVANTYNEGYLDIFLIRTADLQRRTTDLSDNDWAERRAEEPVEQRVPATQYVRALLAGSSVSPAGEDLMAAVAEQQALQDEAEEVSVTEDTIPEQEPETEGQEGQEEEESEDIDFRNYTFAEEVESDTVFMDRYLDISKFSPENNKTEDGRYQPQEYRLRFTTDFAYAGGGLSTYYGSYGLAQIVFSDLMGDHQIAFGSNLVTDLRNSDYFLQYGYLKKRTNYLFNFFHSSIGYQTFSGELLRYRNYGGGIQARYPIDKFRRLDYGLSFIGIAQDYSIAQIGAGIEDNESSLFSYPELTFTTDKTLPGFITPRAGTRYSVGLTGSPPISNGSLQFVSLLGDYRKYFNLGYGYTVALRGSGAASFGRDSQTFFMGGMLGWINQRWSGNSIPRDRLEDTFFSLPALPLRGHEYNSIYGDRFSLINAEFRFPLFAAVLPGPIPIIPLYNITGAAFIDAGAAWGQTIDYTTGGRQLFENEDKLDFKVAEPIDLFNPDNPDQKIGEATDGDILIGAGFGLRTILLGLPFRYDIGWPYYRDGFDSKPIHYFSIGIDF